MGELTMYFLMDELSETSQFMFMFIELSLFTLFQPILADWDTI